MVAAVLIIMVIRGVEVEQVVTAAGSDQVVVAVVQDAGGGGRGRRRGPGRARRQQLGHGRAGRLSPPFMQLHAEGLQAQTAGQGHQGCPLAGAGVQDAPALRGRDVGQE